MKKRFDEEIYRGALLHYLYLIADSCVAIAEMVIRYKNLRPPQSYAEAFDILGENGILDKEFAYSFARIAGFRNFLAHDYDTLSKDKICLYARDNLDEVLEFINQIRIVV
ncbi:MAG: DUF86 domain-containing protein [Candidatus Marinimicrobia bacterium]|nr:DUF86 domain-containing protein [Candidatus Neomarinimicrobiota bacterium]